MLKEEAAIQIRTKNKAAANKEDNIMLKDKGMKNPLSNAITVKKYGHYANEYSEDIWFLDSGCSNHMTGNIALFSALDKNMKSEVTLGTDSKVYVMGKGEVKIFTKQGERKTIADVYYVPRMRCNLLSIGQLVQKGYNVYFVNDVCTIMDIAPSKRCIAEVKMTRNRMFPLRIKADLKNKNEIAAVTQEAFQSVPKDENWLWHLRFGHLNFGGLNLLNRKGMVKGLPLIEKTGQPM
eukprot:PITA_06182